MAKVKERQKALGLRLKKKMSYSQIKEVLGVSKSTLSYWLRDYPLSKERIRELRDLNEARIERYRQTMRLKRERRLQQVCQAEKRRWLPLSKREFYIAGLLLYWGEGGKSLTGSVTLNNTDPKVMRFYLYWLTKALVVPEEKIRVYLHLYSDMVVEKEMNFWSKELGIPRTQFNRPYIKTSKKSEIDHRGFGHGTCTLVVNDVRLKEKIIMGIEAIADFYSEKI